MPPPGLNDLGIFCTGVENCSQINECYPFPLSHLLSNTCRPQGSQDSQELDCCEFLYFRPGAILRKLSSTLKVELNVVNVELNVVNVELGS